MIEEDTQHIILASTYMCTHVHTPNKHVFAYSTEHTKNLLGEVMMLCSDPILHSTSKAQMDCPRSSTVGGRSCQPPHLSQLFMLLPQGSQAGGFYSTTVHQLVLKPCGWHILSQEESVCLSPDKHQNSMRTN